MSVTIGTKLGSYEVLSPIGVGGMGEVYRARDLKLKRDVALKVLPEAFSSDPSRMLRFQREAEVLASLNHPNIAHIYGVEEQALVMELVQGETLSGPLPLETALNYARQIAEALEYAHERGVIHRDLKPANIKVTNEGTVKLLDFGLAKATEDPGSASEDPSNSPTLTLGATRVGVIMGTASYMSPEQASGKSVDKRADIWSFGAVLYEMLTGKKAFEGESVSDTLATVMKIEPNWSALPKAMPASVQKLVRRCLTKDRKQRLRDIGEARIVLENPGGKEVLLQPEARSTKLPWAAAALLAMIAVALGVVAWKHLREEPPHLSKLFFPPPEKGAFLLTGPNIAVSPDGRRVVFEASVEGKRALWVRDLDAPSARMLVEVLSGSSSMPFWAPDSRRLGYWEDTKLKRIDVEGGPAVTIVDAGLPRGGASWNRDDLILFSSLQPGASLLGPPSMQLFRIAAGGGSRAPVTEPDQARKEVQHLQPWFLLDGRHFLYVAYSNDREKNDVLVGDLASKTRKPLKSGGARAIYVSPGYLLFVRDGTLMAQPFDTSKLETTGDAVPVAEQVPYLTVNGTAWGYFSASQNGVLAYTTGGASGNVQLTWFDRAGKKLDTAGAPGTLEAFRLSPDGASVVLARRDPETTGFDLWTRDLMHGSESRLTSDGSNLSPVWSADGAHIFFESNRDGSFKLYRKAANGTGTEEVVEAAAKAPMDTSRDGRYLFTQTPGRGPRTSNDIWVLALSGDRKPFPYVQTEFAKTRPRLSPDGRWLAYQSNESKRLEVYVVSFPQPGGKWQISTNGGQNPVWSPDGRELYYYGLDGNMMAVDIKSAFSRSPQFQFGVPKPLFQVRISTQTNTSFDVSKDGRFLLPALVEQQGTAMTVVLNWPEILKKK